MSIARHVDKNAGLAGLATASALSLAVYLGSGRLRHFDPAVTIYALGSIAAAFAVGYRFAQFCRRPPTWRYLCQAWQLFRKGGAFRTHRNSKSLVSAAGHGRPAQFNALKLANLIPATKTSVGALAKNFVLQNFIRRRSSYRWIMHLCLSGGGTLAFAITFPLVFGWVHFESLPQNAEIYRTYLLGVSVDQFSIHSLKAFFIFNMLNFAALALLAGLIMAVARRLRDAGERATQSFTEDFLPLIVLAIVTMTGLMLTVSYKWLDGRGHGSIGIAHTISVLLLLFYIPVGKLFHMVQRFISVAVSLHKRARENEERVECRRCGVGFSSALHVEDLKIVLDRLGFDYRFETAGDEIHYQEICPTCRRKMLALNQGRSVGR
jgi:hypothetical protein